MTSTHGLRPTRRTALLTTLAACLLAHAPLPVAANFLPVEAHSENRIVLNQFSHTPDITSLVVTGPLLEEGGATPSIYDISHAEAEATIDTTNAPTEYASMTKAWVGGAGPSFSAHAIADHGWMLEVDVPATETFTFDYDWDQYIFIHSIGNESPVMAKAVADFSLRLDDPTTGSTLLLIANGAMQMEIGGAFSPTTLTPGDAQTFSYTPDEATRLKFTITQHADAWVSVIPEPVTAGLGLIGLAALAVTTRRRA